MITAFNLLKQLLKLFFMGSGLWLLWNILHLRCDMKFASFKRAFHNRMHRKAAIALLLAVYFTAYCACSYVYNANQATEVIKLNYEEASKGQNPNQTRFNASQILSDEMLQKVIERGAYDVTTKELAACLHLSSSFDNSGLGDVDNLKIATEYRVHCSSDVLQYDIKPDELLSLLADVYYEYFLENYAENDQILNLDLGSLDDMDYMDVDDYLSMKAFELSSYIKNFGYEDSSFRMDDTGETFASLGEKIDNFSNVELERYRSFVLQNGLSTDKVDYSTRMDYENRLLQVKYEKNMAAYNVRLEAINLYDGQMARIVLVPTSDLNNEFYMSRTKIGVDNFANEADDYLKDATDLRKQMENKQYANSQIQNATANYLFYKQADEMILSMKQELEDLAAQSKKLSDAYLQEKRNGYLYLALVQTNLQALLSVKKSLIYSVGFVGMLELAILLHEVCVAEKKKRGEEG